MTIYLDVVIIENLLMDSIIIYAAATVLKIKWRHTRIWIASLIGAIYSVMSYVSEIEIYSNLIFKIILSILMVYIAYNPQSVKQLWKQTLIFYVTSFLFGGVAFALIYVVKPQEILMKNGLFLGTYALKSTFIGALIAFLLLIASFQIVKTKISKKDLFCHVKIKLNGKEFEIQSMIDTGNLLKEPITGTPVMVVEHTALFDIVPKEILQHMDEILGGDFEKISEEIRNEYIAKLKLIPYSSLGKQNGMLLGIKADKIIIKKEEAVIEKENVIIGMYNKSLTKRGEYRGLIGIELVEEC